MKTGAFLLAALKRNKGNVEGGIFTFCLGTNRRFRRSELSHIKPQRSGPRTDQTGALEGFLGHF